MSLGTSSNLVVRLAPRLRRWLPSVVCLWLLTLGCSALQAVTSDTPTAFAPSVNGTISATAVGNGVAYFGGSFSSVTFNSGSMAALDISTAIPDPSFPQITGGLVDHIQPDGNGGWYVSGQFTTVLGTMRNRIAHINPDKTLDPSFNPNADGRVYNLRLVGTTLYCSGAFTNIGGQARSHLAAIDITTGLATSWNPGANGTICWGLDTSGTTVYVGGDFTTAGGQPRNCIAAIGMASGTASAWNPNASTAGAVVYWITATSNLVYVGGNFTTIGGSARHYLAAIDSTTGLANLWNPNPNGAVWHIFIAATNVLYAAGTFSTVNTNTPRVGIAAFDVSTVNVGTATTWNAQVNTGGIVWWSEPRGANIYIGGNFTTAGGQARANIAALDATSATATAWNPSSNTQVYTLTTTPTQIMVGGPFTTVSNGRTNLVAVDATTGAILPWNPAANNAVSALLLSGNTLYVGGLFTQLGGSARNFLGAVDTGTALATTFNPNCSAAVDCLALSAGTLYAGGTFTTVGGGVTTRNRAAAWTVSTGVLSGWNPNCNNTVLAIAVAGNYVAIGGAFTTLNGLTASHLGATDTAGNVQPFDGGLNGNVQTLFVSSSLLYAGGTFTKASAAGTTRNLAAAWNISTGALDPTWNPNITGTSVSTIMQYLNEVFIAGTYTTVGATAAANLCSVDPTTGSVTAFMPAPDNAVLALATNSASPLFTLYAGGSFLNIGANSRARAAAFNLNQAPTALALSGTSCLSNSPNGTVIGSLTTTDPNPGDTFTYTLTNSAGGLFALSGNTLIVANGAGFNPGPPSYSITITTTDAGGLTLSQAFTITVSRVLITPVIAWPAPAKIVYGTKLSATQLDATANVPGTFAYTPAVGATLVAGTQTLNVVFTPTDPSTYTSAIASTIIVVSPAALTVTANNFTRIFNTANPVFTASYAGFVNGDTASSLGGTLTFATSASTGSAVGTYAITASGLSSSNYTIGYVAGTLTITKSGEVITWPVPASIVYGTQLSATQLNASCTVAGTFVYTPAATTVLNAGSGQTLSVTFTPTDTVNFTTASSSVAIQVTTAALTVTATSVSRAYNTPNPVLGVTYAGFVNGDTAASLGGSLVESTTAVLLSPVTTYPITVSGLTSSNYSIAFVSGLLTVSKATPTLSWTPPANITYGTALSATQLNATASIPGSFSYAPAAGAVLGAGASQTLAVTFTPTDATDYTGASLSTTITVNQATPTITWATPAGITYGTALSATQLNASGSVLGTLTYTPASGTVLTAGSQTLSVTLVPTDTTDYTNATKTVTLAVGQATPTITWATPVGITYGTALSATQLNASGSVLGALTYTPASGTVLTAGSQTLSVTLVPTDTTDYTNVTKTVTLVVGQATPTITWATPVGITYGTALSGTQLNASGSVLGALTYTPASGTVLTAGSQTLSVTLVPTDTTDYTNVTKTVTLAVGQATPTITWATPIGITYGTALSATQLNASGSVLGALTYTPASGTVLTAGSQTLSVTLVPTDTTDYTNVTKTVTLAVAKATSTVAWNPPAAITYGTALGAGQLTATASTPGTFVYSPAAGTVLGAGPSQALNVTFTPTDATDFTGATGATTITVNKATPTISWATPAGITYGTALSATQLNASGSVLGALTYTPASGTVLTAGSQTLSVTLVPTDTTDYTNVTKTVTLAVGQATPTITWATPVGITYGTALSATQLNASGSVLGALTYTPASGTVLTAGSQTLSVTLVPTDTTDYTNVTKTVTLAVGQATPTITWATPVGITYGTALSATQLNASGSVLGALTYTPASGTVLTAGSQTLSVTLVPTDTTDYTTVTKTVTLAVGQATPTISWATPAGITYGTALSATQLNASGSVLGALTYTPASGTVLTAGSQTLSVTLVPTDTTDYTNVTKTVTLAVAKATSTLAWIPPAAITYGTPLGAGQLTATASTPGTFVYSPAAGTVLGAGPSQALNVTFTPTDATDFTGATGATSITVNKATPTITWAPPAGITYGTALSATQLNASGSVLGALTYTPASGTVLTAGSQTLSVTLVPTDTTDYTTVTKTVTLAVGQATPTITWATPAGITYGTALSATQLNASGSVLGALTYTPASGTVLTAGSQTLSVTLVPTDTTDYTNVSKTVTLAVGQATPTITWATPVGITYGTALSATQLNASGSVLGALTYTPASGTVLTAGSQTLSVTLVPTDSTDYTNVTKTVTLAVGQATPTITWATPVGITYGTALSATQLNASGSVLGALTYTPASGTVLTAGSQTLSVTLVPTDSTDYTNVTKTVTLAVGQATPTITWATPVGITYGTALSGTQLNASGSVLGVLTYTPPSGTVLTAGSQTLSVTLVPTDTTDYTNVTKTVTLAVAKATSTVSWIPPAAITYGTALGAGQLTATASTPGTFVYSPAAGTVLGAGPSQALNVTFTPTDATDFTGATGATTITVNKATPTISWATPAGITYGTALSATQLNASGSVLGTLTYTPASGTVLTAGSQTLSVTLVPTDTTDYTNATKTVTLAVGQATPTITWATPAGITYGTALSATQLNASGSVLGVLTYTPASGTVLTAGSQTLSVTLVPTDTTDYTNVTKTVTLAVGQATPTITWATPVGITYGTALSATQLNASGSVLGALTYTPASGTVLTAGSQTLSVTLVPTDTTDYTNATKTVTLAVGQATPTITWATPAGITYGTALSATQLNASGSVLGALTYTPASGTVLTAGSQTLSVTLVPTDSTDYTNVTKTVTLVVGQATPTITWATPAGITYGTALSATQLNASGSVLGALTYTPASGTVLTAGSQTLSVTLVPTDTTDYTNVTKTVTLAVGQATPTITWATPAGITYGTALSATQLNASGSVLGALTYTPASGTVLTAGSQTLSVTLVPTDTTDYTNVTKTVTLAVAKATSTVAWIPPAAITYGTALGAGQLTATASTPGTFVYSPAAGTVLGAGPSQALNVTFTPTDATDFTGATGATTITVNKATPTISWATPAGITYGTALSATQLNASGSVLGALTYTPASGTVLTAGSQTLSVTLVPTDTTDYTNVTKTVTLAVGQATPTITWATPAGITYGTALSGTQLNASGSVLGVLTYTPPSGTVLTAGSQTLSVTLVPTDTTDYTNVNKTVTLAVAKATPAVTWNPPVAITYGTALGAGQLTATASTPGTFVYSPAAGTVLGAGTSQALSVTFTPTDGTDFTGATGATTITVNKATPTISWATPAGITYGTALSATQLNASGSVLGALTYTPASGTVLTAGSQTLSVTLVPTDTTDYTNVTKTVTLAVGQATPTITWATPVGITYGTALSATQLNASGSVLGALTYTPASGTVLTAGSQTLSVTLVPTDTTDYTNVTKTVTLAVGQATPTITWATPVGITYGTALSATQLNASGSVLGALTYTPASGTVLTAGSQTLSVTLVPTDTTDYTNVTKTVTLAVGQATPTITWATPVGITYGTALSATQLNASGSVLGALTYTPASGTVLTAGSQTLSVTLVPTDTTDYATVTKTVTLAVGQATPTITWATPVGITYGTALSGTQLNASGSVLGALTYTPASGTVLTAGSQTLSVTLVPTDTTDYTTVTKTVTLAVGQATPTITWATPVGITYGTALSGTQLNASGSVLGVLTYTPSTGTVLTAGSQTLSVTLVPTDTTDYTTVTKTVTLAVAKATSTVAWIPPAAITYGTPLGAGQLTATASTPGTFVYTPAAGTVLGAGPSQVLNVTFTPTDATDFTGATGATTITVNQATPTISWVAPAGITYGTALSATQLNASGSVLGALTYTPASGTVLTAGSQTLAVTLVPTDTTDYATVTKTVTLAVGQATPTITWATPVGITYGTALNGTQLNASGSVLGALTYTPASGTVLTAGSQTLSVTLVPTDTTDYTTATKTVTLAVGQATPTVTWAAPAGITYGTALSTTQLNAIGSVPGVLTYTPALGTVLGAGNQTLTVSIAPADSTDYTAASASVTLVVAKATPTVAWIQPAAITYGTVLGAGQLTATASTPGTFVYSPAAGTLLTAGPNQPLTVAFTPADVTDFNGATGATTITVSKATPTITWLAPGGITYGTALSATQLNATSSVTGVLTYTPPAGSVLSAGNQTLSVSLVPADTTDYTNASATVTLVVAKATPAITWATPTGITYGTALSATQLNASGSVPGLMTYTPAAGTVFGAGTQTLAVTLAPSDSLDFTSTSTTVSLVVAQASPVLTWPAPAAIVYGTALGSSQLDATASVPGTFAYTPASGTVLPVGANQALSVTFTPTDATDYLAVTSGTLLTVNQITPVITWNAPANITYGTALSGVQLNATASVPGAFSYTPGAGTVLTAGVNQTLSTTFTPTDTVHDATVTVTTTITVLKATPLVTWATPVGIVYGTALSAAQLNATASVPGTMAYAPALGAVLTAGTQTLRVVFTPTDATDFATVNGQTTLTITKAVLKVTASNATRTYGAANPAFAVTFLGFKNGDNASAVSGTAGFTTTATPASVVGSYPIVPALGTLSALNYTFSPFANGVLTINKATLTVTAANKTMVFAGVVPALTSGVTGFFNGDSALVISGAPTLTTTGTSGSNVGSYPIVIKVGTMVATNYTFVMVNGTLAITQAVLTVQASPAARAYGAANPAFSVNYSGFLNGNNNSVIGGAPTITTTATVLSVVGSYPITPGPGTLKATNYSFTFLPGTLAVTKAVLTETATNASRVYGAANPTFSVSYAGFKNGDNAGVVSGVAALSTAATPASAAGSYTIVAAVGTLVATNYSFTPVNGTLTITKAVLTATANSLSMTFGSAVPALTYSVTGFLNGDTIAKVSGAPVLKTTATSASVVGSYAITETVGTLNAASYTFLTANGTMTVTRAVLLVTASNAGRIYGAANPAFSVSYTGFVNGNKIGVVSGAPTIITSAVATSSVGSYLITPGLGTLTAANYSFTFATGNLLISKAVLTVTAVAASRTYGASDPVFTATLKGFLNGDLPGVVSGSPLLTPTATITSPVGNYNIVPSLGTLSATNYSFTYVNGRLTISKALITVTANTLNKVYGAAMPPLTYVISGLLNNDPAGVITGKPTLATIATAASAVNSYAITVSIVAMSATNYSFVGVSGNLVVTPAVLTVAAANASRAYAAANPVFTASVSGLVNGDPASTVKGVASITTTATVLSPVGSYPIVPALGTLTATTNYSFAFVSATLLITPIPLHITANDVTTGFGIAPAFTASYSGFKNGDTASSLGGTVALSTLATLSSPIGTYVISAGQGSISDPNYVYSFTSGTLTIVSSALTVTVTDTTIVLGQTPSFSVTYSTPPLGVISGSLSYSYGPVTVPKLYQVTASGISSPNYLITFAAGTLTVLGATERVSLNADGTQLDSDSGFNALSDGGRFVLFTTGATLDVAMPGYVAGQDSLLRRDQTTGALQLVWAGPTGAGALTGQGAMSGNGRYVAFITPLDQSQPFVSPFEIMVTDMSTGITSLQSVSSGTTSVTAANDWCTIPLISDNGRYVAFSSLSKVVTGQATNGNDNDVIFRDCVGQTTTCLSLTPGGVANTGDSELAAMSSSGRYVAFTSTSTQLVPGTSYSGSNPIGAYIADTFTHAIIRVDLTPAGGQPDDGVGYGMSFSLDGQFLTFSSLADNLVAGGTTPGVENVYLYSMQNNTITLVSKSSAGILADGGCYAPKISGDGRYVAFLSDATNLDPLDTNGHTDIYIADTMSAPLRMTRISLGSTGVQGNGDAIYQIGFSRDGSVVSWYSDATDLLAPSEDSNGSLDVFSIGTWLPAQIEDDSLQQSNG